MGQFLLRDHLNICVEREDEMVTMLRRQIVFGRHANGISASVFQLSFPAVLAGQELVEL